MKSRLFPGAVFGLLILVLLNLTPSVLAQVNIDPPTRTFAKQGGGASILTSGIGTWTATTSAPWLTITPRTSGNAGESCIYVVASNFTADTRQGVININDQTHTVTQTGYAATLSPTSASTDLNGDSGMISITTDAGVSWTAVSNAPWITVVPASGISNGSVTYTVAPYNGVVSRTGSLTIAGRTFSVTQTGEDVNLSPKTVGKAYSSDIVQVQVTALAATLWNVTPNASWISVIDDGNGFGDSTVTLAISTNPSFADRTGTVSIGTATFTINQVGTPNPVLDLLPPEATADPVGAYGNVAVLATPDAPWTAESLDPWLVISGGASGAGNGNIEYVVSANPDLTPRKGRIRVNPPVYVPQVDLTKQLWTYIPGEGNTDDVSGWLRNLSGPIDAFDGTFKRNLSGASFSRE
ncbi:MAG: BACON domain-containing protein, partial [Verrucomicrobiae bacterium]|nr:BACON domain-containing protein [Verrucomicrobiae bacterium]